MVAPEDEGTFWQRLQRCYSSPLLADTTEGAAGGQSSGHACADGVINAPQGCTAAMDGHATRQAAPRFHEGRQHTMPRANSTLPSCACIPCQVA